MAVMMSAIMQIPKNPWPSSHTPGDVITWDDKEWLVCHYDSTNNRVYLIASYTVDNSVFGNNNTYAGSTLAARCTTYQNESMSAEALAKCVDVTVNGVTAKVFVPSYEQFNGGFSWFNSDAHRKVSGAAGYLNYYWTSSAHESSGRAWHVYQGGDFNFNYATSKSLGFRPCVCVQL